MKEISHLTLKEREHLETMLNEGKKLYEIGENLERDPRGIKYEIINHRQLFFRKNIRNRCGNQNICDKQNLCNDCESGLCKFCNYRSCEYHCADFSELPNCKRVNRFPGVCNGCSDVKRCNLPKVYYRAHTAQIEYEKNVSDHKKGPKVDPLELKIINTIVSEGIKKGHSVEVIIKMNNLDISPSTLYRYIDDNLLDVKNIDLKRKVRYKQRKRKKEKTIRKDYDYLKNRKFEDYINFILDNPSANIWQMDTVEGVKGGAVVLSLLFTKTNLQFYFKLESACTEEVNRIFDTIKHHLGDDLFKEIFECILTDNGKENKDPHSLETNNETGEKLISIFYCDPRRSDQKAKCEKNHEHFREMIPKGVDIGLYSVSDINHISNQVNNYPRKALNYHTPIEASEKLLNKKVFELNNLQTLTLDKVNLKHMIK